MNEEDKGASQFECRTCLRVISKSAGCHDIFQPWHSPWNPRKKSTIAEDLTKLVDIVLQESDKHSKVICQGCCVKLYNACQFIVTTKKSDQILKQRNVKDVSETPVSFEGKLWPRPIEVDKNVNSDVFGDTEIKQEVLSDDEDDFDDVETEFRPDMDIKIEPEEIAAPPLRITVNGTIPVDQMGKHRSIVSNGCETFEKVEYLDSTIKEEPESEDESQMDLPSECMLCSKHFNSVSGLKAHVIAHHSYKSVRRKTTNSSPENKSSSDKFICGTCRRAFVTRTDLMVHETCHNKWVCYGCNRSFESFGRLSRHRKFCKAALTKEAAKPKLLEDVLRPLPELTMEKILAHKNEEEPIQETLKCNLCSEKFSDSYYMKIHHEIHHCIDAQKEESKSNVEELSKESKDLETKALQNMFEQAHVVKDKNNVEMEVNLNVQANYEEKKTGEINREPTDEMQMETEVFPVVLEDNGESGSKDDNVTEDTSENAQEQTIKPIENIPTEVADDNNLQIGEDVTENTSENAKEQNIKSIENIPTDVADDNNSQIGDESIVSQEETTDENNSRTNKDVNTDNHVKVSVEIVNEDNEKTIDENTNNDETEESMIFDDSVSQEQVKVQETVNRENVFEGNEGKEQELEESESENKTETVSEGQGVEGNGKENKAFNTVNESTSSQELSHEENIIDETCANLNDNAKNNEECDSVPSIDVRGHEDMEIDSEI